MAKEQTFLDLSPLSILDTLEGYRSGFTDVALWQPYVGAVCQYHGWEPETNLRCGLPGTYPTFILNNRRVIKFFGRLFDGRQAFCVEKAAADLLSGERTIPVPALLGWGMLNFGRCGWPWPYLIYEYIEGTSIGEIQIALPFVEKMRIAEELGRILYRFHNLPLPAGGVLGRSTADYPAFLRRQRKNCADRHTAWGSLPVHLLEQIEKYLPSADELVEGSGPLHLVHADVTCDHLLGRLENGRWQTRALIDFGDAQAADLYYELPALFASLFTWDRRLLAAFLRSYGLPSLGSADFCSRAMSFALLHRFNVFEDILHTCPELAQAATLEEASRFLWEPEIIAVG